LIETGQVRVAFQELQQIIAGTRTTKNRQWSETLEDVMSKFIEICVELRKGTEAKTAIMYYRSLCLPDHTGSLDKIMKSFVTLAEKQAANAQAQSNSESLNLQKDLEDEIPENILMSEVSGEDLKDRKDREIVTPWLKFLWETYRTVLDILKSYPNKDLQNRYHDTSQRAFKFCKDYNRKQEFRRLAEMLRTHLSNIQKYASQKDAAHMKINLTSSETLQNYLDTRFKQLDVASSLELWNEAYKSIEDIHSLIKLSKKSLDPTMLVKFYEHLTKIFWVSENYLLHAYAYYKLYNLRTALKREENMETLSSTLLLAAISIPSTTTDNDILNIDFVEREKQQRMAYLLGLAVPPTKEQLLVEIVKKQVLKDVSSELKNLYQTLEVDFHPLDLCNKMTAVFNFLQTKPELSAYIKPLQKRTLARLFAQLSKVYEVIKISEISKLAPFVSLPEIEREIVLSVQTRHLQMTIDHQTSSIIFGKSVAPFDSDVLRTEVVKLAKKLFEARRLINPKIIKTEQEAQVKFVTSAVSNLEKEHAELLDRKQFIEKKKIYLANEKKKEDDIREVKAREAAKRREEEEKIEQERQQQKREEESKKRKEEEEKQAQAQKMLEELGKNNAITDQTLRALAQKAGKKGKKGKISLDAANIDVDTLLEVKREEIERVKRDKEKRLTDEARNLDYLERTRRLEEIPLLKQHYEKQRQQDKEAHETLVRKTKEDFEKMITEMTTKRSELEKMFEDKNEFVEKFVMAKRREQHEQRLAEYNKKKEDARAKWLARREKVKQEMDRMDEEKKHKQRERDEKERIRREEEEERRRQRDADANRLHRITEIQLQKERELEERQRQERERVLASRESASTGTPSKPSTYRPPVSSGSRWGDDKPTTRRFDDDKPPTRRFDDDGDQPRRTGTGRFGGDDQPWQRGSTTSKRTEDSGAPFQQRSGSRWGDDKPPTRRFDDDKPPTRRFDDNNDDRKPPTRRFDDDGDQSRRTGTGRFGGDDQPWQRGSTVKRDAPTTTTTTKPAESSTGGSSDDGWQQAKNKPSSGRWRP
jgi:translation initiation factor 3 subunit A